MPTLKPLDWQGLHNRLSELAARLRAIDALGDDAAPFIVEQRAALTAEHDALEAQRAAHLAPFVEEKARRYAAIKRLRDRRDAESYNIDALAKAAWDAALVAAPF